MRAHRTLFPLLLLLAVGVACGRRDLVGQQVCGNQLVELLSFICRGRYYSPRDRRVSGTTVAASASSAAPAAPRPREAPLRPWGEGAAFGHSAPGLRSDGRLQPPPSVLSRLPLRQDAFVGASEGTQDAFRKRGWAGGAWQPPLPPSLPSDFSSVVPRESSSGLLQEDRWGPPFLPRRSAFALLKSRDKRGFTIVDECCRLKACNLDELLAYCG
ncbi:uncharacterized protein [Penaeus vannamei]|uniref:uncharacterized protein n=1 Tax=Penaeus vannamei TaxID=6689 RepID=UPI00387F4499